MQQDFDRELEERLVRYAAIDTQSDEASPTSPSSERQFALLNLLRDELAAIGASDIRLTGYGTLLATLPATLAEPAPTVGLLAHVDTAPQFNATGVKPVVHRRYDGGAIRFADAPDLVLSPEESPYLAGKVGDDIVTASGTTLLGADDKAGVAIVMTVARHLLAHPEIAHGPIRLAFTPDEEIGRGVHADLPRDLAVDVAYTFDGGDVGEIVLESFSADKAVVRVRASRSIRAGPRDKLVNALHLAAKILDTLPQATRTPETTDGVQGFIHCLRHAGNRRRGRDGVHPARLRARRAGGARRAARPGRARRSRPTEPRATVETHDHPAVPQHALLARAQPAAGRARARGLPADAASRRSPSRSAAAPTARG